MASFKDAWKISSFLIDLSRKWSSVSKANPITPKRIVDTLKMIWNFFTVACLLIILTGCEAKTNVKVYTHVPTKVQVTTTVASPTQVLPDPVREQIVDKRPEVSLLVPTQVLPDPVREQKQAAPEHSVLAPADYDVRIWADGGAYRDGGSGTLFRPDAVITCYHTFREAKGAVTITFRDGTTVKGTVVDADKTYDLATVKIDPVKYTPAKISESNNLQGDFEARGYGAREEKFRVVHGKFIKFTRPTNSNTAASTLIFTGACRSGDSGGGIFNDGGLYGVIWGTNEEGIHGTSGAGFHQYLRHANAVLDSPVSNANSDQGPKKFSANRLEVFSNPKECLPCRQLLPVLASLKQQGYNIHEQLPTAEIRREPTLVFFDGDKEVAREEGFQSEDSLKSKLRK